MTPSSPVRGGPSGKPRTRPPQNRENRSLADRHLRPPNVLRPRGADAMTATGRVLMRGVRLAVLVTALGSAIAPTGAHTADFIDVAAGHVAPYHFYTPRPYPYYYTPY